MKHPLPNALARLCRRIAPAVLLLLGLAQPAWAALTVNAGNGTVTDSTTSLVWDQCPYGLTGATCATGTALYGTWAGALNAAVAANTANYKGFNDWRVPNKNELESIAKIDTYTAGQPAIDTTAFPGTPLDWFWTSTTYAPGPSHAWLVYFGNGDPDAGNKTSANFVRLVRSGQSFASFDLFAPSADLSITKTDGVTTAVPGASVTYTITASNAGPSNAPGTTVADTLPAALTGATWTCVGAAGGTCTASGSGNLNDTVNLPAGGSVTYTLTATVSAAATGTLSNTATVSSAVPDPVSGNNIATDTDSVTVIYAITATASPLAGGAVSCTPNLVSHGASSTCTASANAGYTFSAFSGACTGATCSLSNVTGPASVTATFTLSTYAITATASPLAGGTVSCTPNPVSHGASSTCTASANAGYTFSAFSGACTGATCSLSNVTGPASVTATFTLTPQADLSITLTDAPDPVIAGANLTYTVTVSNAGPSAAATASWSDTLPAGTTFVSLNTVAGWSCTTPAVGSNGLVACNKASLASAGSAGFSLVVTVAPATPAGTILTNTVTVSSATSDPTPVNNSATTTTTVSAVIIIDPPPPEVTIPQLSVSPACGLATWPSIVNLSAGEGPAFAADMVTILSKELGMPLRWVEQTAACGSVALAGYNGGNLAFIPFGFQTGDGRANGIYPVGNGQYQLVRNGQQLTLAPALVHLDQLAALLPGIVASQADNGVITTTYNGLTYVVQPSVAVQLEPASGVAQLVVAGDGLMYFIDAQGNKQVLYPAFTEPRALRNILRGLDLLSTLSIELDGTASIVYNGQRYTLVPDMTLLSVPADRAGQDWWQESDTRYRVTNVETFPWRVWSQGFTVRP